MKRPFILAAALACFARLLTAQEFANGPDGSVAIAYLRGAFHFVVGTDVPVGGVT